MSGRARTSERASARVRDRREARGGGQGGGRPRRRTKDLGTGSYGLSDIDLGRDACRRVSRLLMTRNAGSAVDHQSSRTSAGPSRRARPCSSLLASTSSEIRLGTCALVGQRRGRALERLTSKNSGMSLNASPISVRERGGGGGRSGLNGVCGRGAGEPCLEGVRRKGKREGGRAEREEGGRDGRVDVVVDEMRVAWLSSPLGGASASQAAREASRRRPMRGRVNQPVLSGCSSLRRHPLTHHARRHLPPLRGPCCRPH